MQEAREAAKLKMKQIELQKKEVAKKASFLGAGDYTTDDLNDDFLNRHVPSELVQATVSSQIRIGKGMKLGKTQDSKLNVFE